jgi:raffinose/stachyose/melibiose transport system substrate-binding protein
VFALGLGASEARPAGSDHVTISMLALQNAQTAYDALISNFEHAYPNITVEPTYTSTSSVLFQLETTELAAGSAPDVLYTLPGSGSPVSIVELARAGDLAPMINAPWTKRSPRAFTSLDKNGPVLYAFTPAFTPFGVFTDNALFARLGVAVPQTFSQLLAICHKAHAAGLNALQFGGANPTSAAYLIFDLAAATLYGHDKDWNSQLRAGTVSFDGTPGWHQALQEFIDMNTNSCFQPGFTGGGSDTFAQGQALMSPVTASLKAILDAANPQFTYSFYPFPGGTSASQTRTWVGPVYSLSINAHASPQAQAAAQTFIDFIAQPRQDALYARTKGALTPSELLTGQVPAFMSPLGPSIRDHQYVSNPSSTWWNPDVLLALETDAIGLVTGQESIDSVLKAMDAAWKQGPA